MSNLSGKVAVITGAGQGVGQGIALAMAAAGAKVVVAGRTLEKVEVTAEAIRARGGEALALACNVKDAADLAVLLHGFGDLIGQFQPLGPGGGTACGQVL